MTDHSPAERVLSGFLRVILDQQFTSQERLYAAKAIRSGEIIDCVLKYLDFNAMSSDISDRFEDKTNSATLNNQPKGPTRSDGRMENLTVDQLFDLTRKKKFTRSEVLNIIGRLYPGAELESDNLSLRQALSFFKSIANDVQWLTLFKIINGDVNEDPYVASILRHR